MLLILNYTAQGEWKKAGQVTEELITNNKNPLLYIIKAGIIANALLSKETKMVFYENEESLGIEQVNQHSDETEKRDVSEEVMSLIKAGAQNLIDSQTPDLSSLSELQGSYSPSLIIDYQKLLLLGAEILIKIRSYDYAESLLELSKAKNLNESEYLYYKGLILQNKEDYSGAIEFYQASLLKNSNSYAVRLQLGIIYLTVDEYKDLTKAEKYLHEAIKFEETPEILYFLGTLNGLLNNTKRSSEYLVKAIETIYKKTVLPYSILSTEILLD